MNPSTGSRPFGSLAQGTFAVLSVNKQDLSRASFENPPFVAWHSGRQNSTGRETSFWVIAYTGRFGEGYLAERQRRRLPTLREKLEGWATRNFNNRSKGHEALERPSHPPAPFANGAKGCGTRKFRVRTNGPISTRTAWPPVRTTSIRDFHGSQNEQPWPHGLHEVSRSCSSRARK